MTEQEYILAGNRVNVTRAKDAIRDILPGDDWGISEKEVGEVMQTLCEAEERLFGMVCIDLE